MLANYNLLTEKPKAEFLWKFVDMNKFLSMLQNAELHFCSLDNLNDIFEGANIINSSYIQRDYTVGFMPAIQRNSTFPEEVFDERKESFRNRIKALRKYQENFFVDCFFQGEEESVAMWNSYSADNGIAIKFNSELLLEEISKFYNVQLSKNFEFGYGSIAYEKLTNPDYEKFLIGDHHDLIFEPFKKDVFHMHENEYRFIFYKKGDIGDNHIKVKIDLAKTIRNIVAHPNSPDWVIETIYNLVLKYELVKEVHKSRIITSEMASKILK